MRETPVQDEGAADDMPDLTEHRPEVVRRLLARGVPPRALEALLPGWELLITDAGPPRLAVPQETAAS